MDPDWLALEREISNADTREHEQDLYAIRVKLVDKDGTDIRVVILPWLTCNQGKVRSLAGEIVAQSFTGVNILNVWLNSDDVALPDGRWWQPIAAQIVKLAVVPF